jgi:hypothetical protein
MQLSDLIAHNAAVWARLACDCRIAKQFDLLHTIGRTPMALRDGSEGMIEGHWYRVLGSRDCGDGAITIYIDPIEPPPGLTSHSVIPRA